MFDSVTPLLNQWTYQAMVGEMIGLEDNLVDEKFQPSKKQLMLSIDNDEFFAKNAFSNFGDLAKNVKEMMDEFQNEKGKIQNFGSIDEMHKFLENFKDIRDKHTSMTNHVDIMSELSHLIERKHLFDLSKLEQEMVVNYSRDSHYSVN